MSVTVCTNISPMNYYVLEKLVIFKIFYQVICNKKFFSYLSDPANFNSLHIILLLKYMYFIVLYKLAI